MKSGVSLQQMLTEVKRQSESKEDYLIAPNRLRMESYGKEMFLHLSDDSGTELIEPMTITGIAHRQIGTHLRIPAAYYDRMREERPDLLAYNANTWFKQENSQRMLRTLDGSARAYLSNRYRRIDERGFAIQMTVHNTSESAKDVVIGLNGCWASSWHCVNEDKPLSGKATCFRSGWNSSLIFEYHAGFPMFAFAPMADAQTDSSFTCSDDGSITYDLSHHCTIAADGTASVVFYWGLSFEEVAAATSAKEMLRQTFDAELTTTRTWLQERRVTFNGDAKLTQLYNTNLFFCMFFSTGITLDTEELVLVTSRSPRYYVSAAYWDRDSLLWSFPAILDADPERAKEMLYYVFGRQRRNFGIHSRYIDGTVLEPGFELDELVAPLLALERYINKTDDKSILSDSDIVQGISLILNRLRQHEAASCRLYDTFLQPTDDEHVYPYITYDNVLVWKALKDLAQLAPQYAHLEKTASEIKDAIMTHCVQKDAAGKPYFGWSIDLNGSHDVYDEPPGSLQLLPLFGFCSPTDEVYRNTVAMIEAAARQIRFDTGCNLFANSSDTIIVNVEPKRHPAGVLAWHPPVRIRMKRKTSRKRKVLPHPSKNAPTGSRRRNVTIPIRRRIKPYCNQAI